MTIIGVEPWIKSSVLIDTDVQNLGAGLVCMCIHVKRSGSAQKIQKIPQSRKLAMQSQTYHMSHKRYEGYFFRYLRWVSSSHFVHRHAEVHAD